MTVKVVRGVVSSVQDAALSSRKGGIKVSKSPLPGISSISVSTVVSSDAAINKVSRLNQISPTEKIRSNRQARRVANNVAERVRDDERAGFSHSKLYPPGARGYLVN